MALRPLRSALGEWTPGRALPAGPLQAVIGAWPAIVGAGVAVNSQPLSLNGTTLVVATRSSAWSQQLQFLSLPILAGLRALQPPVSIERIVFRVAALRPGAGAPPQGAKPAGRPRRRAESPSAAESDLAGTLARLRRRMAGVRAAAPRGCSACGAPLERTRTTLCAPCRGAREGERALRLERILYMAPWLECSALREQLEGLSEAEYDHVRRRLLQRWWLVLERARRAAPRPASRLERQVASSYVLLHSRLPPDRITPAIVRNLLGAELEALLWPEHAPDGNAH